MPNDTTESGYWTMWQKSPIGMWVIGLLFLVVNNVATTIQTYIQNNNLGTAVIETVKGAAEENKEAVITTAAESKAAFKKVAQDTKEIKQTVEAAVEVGAVPIADLPNGHVADASEITDRLDKINKKLDQWLKWQQDRARPVGPPPQQEQPIPPPA